jgi:hypothetical protein
MVQNVFSSDGDNMIPLCGAYKIMFGMGLGIETQDVENRSTYKTGITDACSSLFNLRRCKGDSTEGCHNWNVTHHFVL